MTGRFIAFEGGEGAGKSTQIALLAEKLRKRGHNVLQTREPGGSPGAEQIRVLFVTGEPNRWLPATDALLIAAARSEHVNRSIKPALQAGWIVLCDRYIHSTLAYQGYGKGQSTEDLLRLHKFATNDLWPELVFWLDLPVEQGLRRSFTRNEQQEHGIVAKRFEDHDMDFHQRVRTGFANLAKSDDRIVRVDATQSIKKIAKVIASKFE